MSIKEFVAATPYIAFLFITIGSLAAYMLGIMNGEMFSAISGAVVGFVCGRDRGTSNSPSPEV